MKRTPATYQLTYAGLAKCQELDREELAALEGTMLLSWSLPARRLRREIRVRMFSRAAKMYKAELMMAALLAGGEADFVRAEVALETMHNGNR